MSSASSTQTGGSGSSSSGGIVCLPFPLSFVCFPFQSVTVINNANTNVDSTINAGSQNAVLIFQNAGSSSSIPSGYGSYGQYGQGYGGYNLPPVQNATVTNSAVTGVFSSINAGSINTVMIFQ